jgi:hypothetical protein
MSNPSLLVTYRGPEAGSGGPDPGPDGGSWLRLEQAPIEEPGARDFQTWFAQNYGSDWSKFNFGQMMEYWEQFRSMCNEEGEFIAEIRVHKSAPDLPYRLDATRGQWQYEHAQAADEQKTDQLAIRQEASARISGENVVSIVCAQWEGNVYDELGAQLIPRPRISVDPDTWVLSWGRPVTGTLRVVYVTEYDVWFLVISPRTTTGDSVGDYAGEGGEGGSSAEDGSGYGVAVCTEAYDEEEPESVYAATVYGVYAGGIEELAVETPDLEGNCGGGGGGGDDDDDDDPPAECYKLKVKYHKCTGEKISEDLIRVPCPDQSNES